MAKHKKGKMPSVMKHRFSEIPKAKLPRSVFDRTSGYKTTFDAGYLIPFYLDEVLPGDTFNVQTTAFGRLATPIHPIMDNMYFDTFYFFVPNRLVWDNWEKFCGERTNPESSIDYIVPIVTAASWNIGSLGDYFGLPANVAGLEFNALPFRAYNLIYNEWFRDQNLQNPLIVDTDDGPDAYSQYAVRRRGKRHDYFTSALPWPQKGDSIPLPLGTTAPLNITGSPSFTTATETIPSELFVGTATTNVPVFWGGVHSAVTEELEWDDPGLEVDLSTATAATFNQLRQAFQIQKLLERDARGGTRYVEVLLSHFGVQSPDFRLQRPEYLGGSSSPVNITPVASTVDDATIPQGNLAGVGTMMSKSGFSKSFVEHGMVIGLCNIRADLTYQQGLHRYWSRSTRYDFYWPALAHLGEQAVLNKEIYFQGTSADDEVFGYQERFAEYRYKPSQITGLFRSVASGSLDVWHLSQEFSALPTLGDTFIQDNPPIDRVIAVDTEPHMIADFYIKNKTARVMPVYGVPGLIDHF